MPSFYIQILKIKNQILDFETSNYLLSEHPRLVVLDFPFNAPNMDFLKKSFSTRFTFRFTNSENQKKNSAFILYSDLKISFNQ